MANKERYLSGKQKLTPLSGLSTDRHVFLSPQEAEPNLGYPGERSLPVKDYYYNLVTFENGGQYDRYWQVAPAGIITGISVFEEGSIVGTGNSINKLNFVGNIVTVAANTFGTISTITISPPGNDNEIIFNDNGSFAASPYLLFDNVTGVMTVGQYFDVGVGGTIIRTTAQGFVGINTNAPTQELHVQGDIRLTGTIYDGSNNPGTPGQILIKNSLGNLTWISNSAVTSGAGGTIGQIQFHSSTGLVDGATNFWYDYTNQRIGIGSTTPRFVFDVVGDSGFAGPVRIKDLLVTGVSTFIGVSTFSRVGIGTTIPTAELAIYGNTFSSGIITATLFDGRVSAKAITEQVLTTTANKTNDLLLLYSASLNDVRKISIQDASLQGVQGIQGNQGVQGSQGRQGTQGTAGPQGFQGVQGSQGIQGIGGGPGSQGIQGIQGYQGIQGFQGNQGNQGIQGRQGIQGNDGAQGNQGIQGISGQIGGAGSQGLQGIQGYQGIQGNQGIQGRQGIQGTQGIQGIQGFQGFQGFQGNQGNQGIQGFQGNQGFQGTGGATGGTGGQGLQGLQGLQGNEGPQGTQGIQGEQGIQGAQGFQGIQGNQGIQGIQGRQGIQGNNGNQGAQGFQGIQGFQGNQGIQGDNGAGSQGIQGFQGRQGVQGIKGDLGSQGIQGIQGIQGEQGIQGINGTGNQGIQGNIGPQGVQGVQGNQGISGTVGGQGLQGIQGIQGIQGTAAGSGQVPSGTVVWFATNTAPSGYLFCNGSAISRLVYNALFSVISTNWGSGDGFSTFNIPDFRGEFIRGWADTSAVDSGRTFGSFQDHQYQTHTHNIPTRSNTGTNAIPRTAINTGTLLNIEGGSPNATNGGNFGSETRPRNYALLPCIKT
jgi:microcystin-dependent protein